MPDNDSSPTPASAVPAAAPGTPTRKLWNSERLYRLRDGLPWPFVNKVRETRRPLLITACILAGICVVSLIGLTVAWQSFRLADPQLHPELASLREQFKADPRNAELKEQIRALDYAQRQRFFQRHWQLDLFGWAALLSGGIALLYFKGWIDAGRERPFPLAYRSLLAAARKRKEDQDGDNASPAQAPTPPATPEEEPRDPALIDELTAKHGSEASALIPILNAIQARYRYLPDPMISLVEEKLGLSRAHVDGVISFYHQFRLKPCGKSLVKVCVGTACHVAGASRIIDQLKRNYHIPADGDTAPDRSVTIEEVACIGCCMLAPAADLDGNILGPTDSKAIAAAVAHPNPDKTTVEHATGTNGTSAPGQSPERSVALCLCSSCRASGAGKVATALQEEIRRRQLPVKLEFTSCEGESSRAPLVHVRAKGVETARYGNVLPGQASALLRDAFPPRPGIEKISFWSSDLIANLAGGRTPAPVAVNTAATPERPRIAASDATRSDPVSLEEYRREGGFRALAKATSELSPEGIIEMLKESGLRGRGGAGFPTGVKWEHVVNAGNRPIVVCNGDEGDPGAFMDRMLMENFPFRVLEGMAVASFVTGAEEGILYIRAEYPLAIRRIEQAIADCEKAGLLGDRLASTGHPFRVRVVSGAGAFVCGEETALLASLEGERGEPRQRPPYPAVKGAWGRSTLINNVESFCNVPWILLRGAAAFKQASASPERSGGTKTFALAGKINRPGLIEVPIGTTIREIVYDIGGGVKDGKTLKAVQIGGPSGGCVPADMIDTPIDYDTLAASGSIMGSGGMVVLSEEDCMVDVARYFMEFATRESCGKCAPCRIGTTRMLEILTRLCAGKGSAKELKELESIAELTRSTSLCGLGKTAPNPLVSTLRHFRHEYEAHVAGRCPAGVCTELIRYEITDACIGCTICATDCPVDAIPFTPHQTHSIDNDLCIRCDTCRVVCPEDAVAIMTGDERVRGGTGQEKNILATL